MSLTWDDRKQSRARVGNSADRTPVSMPTGFEPGPLDPSRVDELLEAVTTAERDGTNRDYIRAWRACYDAGVPKHLVHRASYHGRMQKLRRRQEEAGP